MKLNPLKLFVVLFTAFFLHSQAVAKELVLGLIPAENNEEMIQKFEPMRQYLEKKIGARIRVFTATDYTSIIEGMKKKRVDIAWLGPFAYILAEREANAEAFAVGVRADTGLSTYRSIFVVPEGSPAQTLADLKGKRVAFVDPTSASGNLIPSYLVKKKTGAMPKVFFGRLIYAGSHDAAEMAVKNKTVDAAADNDITYDRMLKQGLITRQSNRILLQSEPFPGAPLVYRSDLPENIKASIRGAVLNAHVEMQQVTGYGELMKYEAISPDDYHQIRDLIKELNLL